MNIRIFKLIYVNLAQKVVQHVMEEQLQTVSLALTLHIIIKLMLNLVFLLAIQTNTLQVALTLHV